MRSTGRGVTWPLQPARCEQAQAERLPPLITEVPAVIMSVTAVKVENATTSSTKKFPFVTHHTTVWTNKRKVHT